MFPKVNSTPLGFYANHYRRIEATPNMSPPWESRQQYKWRHHKGEIDAIIVNRSDETEMIVSGYQYIVAEIKRDLKKNNKKLLLFLKSNSFY